MGGRLVPRELLATTPALSNFFSNPITVQWAHRLIGTVLGLAVIVFFVRVLRTQADHASRRLNTTLLTLVLTQYLLGVLTLLMKVPVSLGVIHQATALMIFGTWLWWVHHVRNAVPRG
jgi:cytochrome c oxidase assembly protein subunit 15